MIKTVVAIDGSLKQTADLLEEKGFDVVGLSMAADADAVVFSASSGSSGQLEDIGGTGGVVAIDGNAREPREVLTLIMNRSGYID